MLTRVSIVFLVLACATTGESKWVPAQPSIEQRSSLARSVKADANGFLESYGIRLGATLDAATAQLGSEWSCKRLGKRSAFWGCSHESELAPAGLSLELRDDRVVAVALHWPSQETRDTACAEYQEALKELSSRFGAPTRQRAQLCERQPVEPEYVESCSAWIVGASAMVFGAKPILEHLDKVTLGLTIGPSETSTCRTEAPPEAAPQ